MIQEEQYNASQTQRTISCGKDWEDQSISSESEVTLRKFDSDLVQEDGGPNINILLAKYPVEERIHFMVNRSQGIILDSRDGKLIQRLMPLLQKKNTFPEHSPYSVPLSIPSEKFNSKMKSKTKSELQDNSLCTEENIWDDYWQQSEKMHQKLLMGICQKDNKILNELFSKKNNSIPLNVNYKSFDNWTPIHFSALHGNTFALILLLEHKQIYINSLTNFKWSALHVSTKNNKIQTIKKLLDHGIQPNYQDEDGNTALHYAVELGYKETIEILIKNAPDLKLDLQNNQGLLPCDLTSDSQILKLLGVQTENLGMWSRGNRHIQRLLEKVNAATTRTGKAQIIENKLSRQKSDAKQRLDPKRNSRKQNLAKMYQLLKQKKPAQRVGLQLFKFYKKIGQGAFGEVYIVKKIDSEKLYALKAIKKQKIFGTNLMRYIQTEKEVLSLINHPFIVHLHYAFQTEAHLFLVMDYCEGGDLGKALENKRKFDEKTVKKYAAEILLAIQALHRQKIIYRDLKPDNIVLDKDGHALLTDFGLSKKTVSIDDINKSFCGTPAYLPLEIINKKGHNRMADWYEYGVVLYQLHTGIPPFYAQTRQELYQNVRTGIVRFPKGSSQAFRDLIKKLLAQNPEKRLGFQNDAQSIKSHKWFDDVDWDQVIEKRMTMPPIQNKVPIGNSIKTKFIENRTDKYLISDWSFIAP